MAKMSDLLIEHEELVADHGKLTRKVDIIVKHLRAMVDELDSVESCPHCGKSPRQCSPVKKVPDPKPFSEIFGE